MVLFVLHNSVVLIAYRHYKDIDVEFEDGTVVEHTRRDLFMNGYIKNPSIKITKQCAKEPES